jgi:phage baseplate assembly protein W
MASLGVKFPFEETDRGGIFRPNFTDQEATKSNLIAFLTLRRGQRPMNNALYSPLYDYLFENFDDIAETELYRELEEKIQRFFPEIELAEILIDFVEEENRLKVEIAYSIPQLGGVTDSVQLDFDTEDQI